MGNLGSTAIRDLFEKHYVFDRELDTTGYCANLRWGIRRVYGSIGDAEPSLRVLDTVLEFLFWPDRPEPIWRQKGLKAN